MIGSGLHEHLLASSASIVPTSRRRRSASWRSSAAATGGHLSRRASRSRASSPSAGARAGVGKSTVAANLAIAVAERGNQVVLVDLDLSSAVPASAVRGPPVRAGAEGAAGSRDREPGRRPDADRYAQPLPCHRRRRFVGRAGAGARPRREAPPDAADPRDRQRRHHRGRRRRQPGRPAGLLFTGRAAPDRHHAGSGRVRGFLRRSSSERRPARGRGTSAAPRRRRRCAASASGWSATAGARWTRWRASTPSRGWCARGWGSTCQSPAACARRTA